MTNVQLLQLAQATAAEAATSKATNFGNAKAVVDAFTGSGNPDSDWDTFAAGFQRELQSYRNAVALDAKPAAAPAGAAAAAASGATIPPEILARLPQAVQDRLKAANAPVAPKPVEKIAEPAKAAPASAGPT